MAKQVTKATLTKKYVDVKTGKVITGKSKTMKMKTIPEKEFMSASKLNSMSKAKSAMLKSKKY